MGRLGGTNGVVVDPTVTAAYTEQRVNAFFTYGPPMLDGKASLTAAFEVDFAFGDRSYGIGGNVGGGFGGDQVNLQTRRLHADFFPSKGNHSAHVIVGLQFLADGVADPTRSTPDQMMRSGGRLAFFASEAAGASVYGRWTDDWGTRLRYRAGVFTLAESGLSLPDDVLLAVGDLELRPAQATGVGLHLWYLQDRSGGLGGALGLGPTSALYELQGGASLDPYDGLPPPEGAPIDADLFWTGLDAGYNAALDRGPVGVHGVAVANLGRIYAPIVHDDDVVGGFVDLEARFRFAPGDGSVARVEGLYSTGAGDDPLRYGGVVTGNAYGIAGALMPTHGTMLLFPDPRAINRLVAVVSDASGAGLGIAAVSGSVGYDLVPSRINLLGRAATAFTAAGESWGTEVGGAINARPLPLCDVGLHVATVLPGPAAQLTAAPWAGYLALDWLVL